MISVLVFLLRFFVLNRTDSDSKDNEPLEKEDWRSASALLVVHRSPPPCSCGHALGHLPAHDVASLSCLRPRQDNTNLYSRALSGSMPMWHSLSYLLLASRHAAAAASEFAGLGLGCDGDRRHRNRNGDGVVVYEVGVRGLHLGWWTTELFGMNS